VRPLALALLALLALPACRRHAPDSPQSAEAPDACKRTPLTLYPMSTEATLVEEEKYQHLVQEISGQVNLALPDKVLDLRKFGQVTSAPQCPGGMRVETRLVSLIHKRREFHFKVAGKVFECGSEEFVHRFELEENNNEISEVADRLADAIANELTDAKCRGRAEAALPPPPPPPPPQ
jgi:hypothetical protein